MCVFKISVLSLLMVGANTCAGFANGFAEYPQGTLAPQPVAKIVDAAFAIDPIVTGNSISTLQLKIWKVRKERYDECGLCGDIQEFPSELPLAD